VAAPSSKLDSALRHQLALRSAHAKASTHGVGLAPLPVSASGKVLVDVYVNGAMRPAATRLRDTGMRVDAVSGRSPQRMVEGWIPLTRLDVVARMGMTKAVTAVQGGFTNTGSVL
jgi:hypothetical protein